MRSRRSLAVLLAALALAALAFGTAAAFGDLDGDDVTSLDEYRAGTDPLRPDTDEDGLDDGVERDVGTNATSADTDGDSLVDGRETGVGTDPLAADTDGDGLDDAREVNALATDPTVADTDGDGLTDGEEVEAHGTDSLRADTDDDGLADGAEVTGYESSPTTPDTDGDGVADGREARVLGTDPTTDDTDDDRLPDAAEVDVYDTDPTSSDTDGDGLDDGVEAADSGPLARADPLARDVFLELDYMRGHRPNATAISLVVDEYANAPIANPDGSTGISLHVAVDDAVPRERTTSELDSLRLRLSYFDNETRGYHHAIVVRDARVAGDSVAGFATTGHLVAQTSGRDGEPYTTRGQAHVLMHELGHAVGLSNDRYEGIDSYDVPHERYESVMNYNAPWETLGYSTDAPFDDWMYLEANMYGPPALAVNLPVPSSVTTNTTTTNATA
ncbi:hypothetical protein [Halorubellus sp. PRR65]|uniref:hypothetical protein n=1 Tax=Halorubellus sp. PRR65 TaxID=3098148 RepID=UPI002B2614EC|nr:hypothetical protein [Halorubellus sp. PRR65]